MKQLIPNNTARSCIDCRYVQFGMQLREDRCTRGEGSFCSLERSYNYVHALIVNACGKRGRFFAQRDR